MLAAAPGCTGVFAADGTSVSFGSHARGTLIGGAALPPEGAGYWVPPAWRARGRQYATEEMVRWLTRAFASVDARHPGSLASVGDLSGRGGGNSREHKSHESGRDVDIFFYAMDEEGRPLRPGEAMLRFAGDGRAVAWSPAAGAPAVRTPVPRAWFDAARTWALVRALLSDGAVEVQWIFIHRALGEALLSEAAAAGEDPALLARAAALFHQPTDAQPHDDHMHVRIFCAPDDRAFGCSDRGPRRWWKKRWKYLGQATPAPELDRGPLLTSDRPASGGPPRGASAP